MAVDPLKSLPFIFEQKKIKTYFKFSPVSEASSEVANLNLAELSLKKV